MQKGTSKVMFFGGKFAPRPERAPKGVLTLVGIAFNLIAFYLVFNPFAIYIFFGGVVLQPPFPPFRSKIMDFGIIS